MCATAAGGTCERLRRLTAPWDARLRRGTQREPRTVAVVVAPWIVRNAVQVGTPELATSDGFTLAAVYAQPAQAANTFVDPVLDAAYEDDKALKLAQFDEPTWSDKLLLRVWDGVRSHPGYIVTNARRNTLEFAELANNEAPEISDGRNLDFRRATLRLVYVVSAPVSSDSGSIGAIRACVAVDTRRRVRGADGADPCAASTPRSVRCCVLHRRRPRGRADRSRAKAKRRCRVVGGLTAAAMTGRPMSLFSSTTDLPT